MPMLPPAPGTFVTCTLFEMPACVSTCCMERAVWSQPPPGAAGAMILSSHCPTAPAEKPTTAAAASAPRQRPLPCILIISSVRAALLVGAIAGTLAVPYRGGKRRGALSTCHLRLRGLVSECRDDPFR